MTDRSANRREKESVIFKFLIQIDRSQFTSEIEIKNPSDIGLTLKLIC